MDGKPPERKLTAADLQSNRLTRHRLVNEKCQSDGLSPILAGATNGHLSVVRCLVKSGADINDRNPEGQTPLILAAKNGYQHLLRLLVNYGAQLDIQDHRGRTALIHALSAGHVELAGCLIDAGASQRAIDSDGKTALFVAAECGHMAIVEQLLTETGVDLNARDRQSRTVLMMLAKAGKAWPLYKYIGESRLAELINDCDSGQWTPLLYAAAEGKFLMGGRLLDWGSDPKIRTADGQTTIMLACQRSQIFIPAADTDADFGDAGTVSWDQKKFVAAMIERGVEIDAADKQGRTALFYAAECAELEMLRYLLSMPNGPLQMDSLDSAENTVLHAAARAGRQEIVRYLAGSSKLSSYVNVPNSQGDVPLRLAVVSKILETVLALIDCGACLEKADSCCDPPLLRLASEYGAEEVVAFLLDNDALAFNPNSADSQGVTALMTAARNDHIGIVERLLKASANPNLLSNKGFTALTVAVQTVNIAICRTLLKHNADPNLMPEGKSDAKSLCSIAATLDNCVLLDLLLESNANAFQRDSQGRNALFYSLLLNRIEPLKILAKSSRPDDLDELFAFGKEQYTLLAIAAEKGLSDAFSVLLSAEPFLDIKMSTGEAVLHIACRRQDHFMVSELLTYILKVDLPRDSDQCTPLMVACHYANVVIARDLIRMGADVNKRTPEGGTALTHALLGVGILEHRVKLITLLRDCGATYNQPQDIKLEQKFLDFLEDLDQGRIRKNDKMKATTEATARISGASADTVRKPQATPRSTANQSQLKAKGGMTTEERLKLKLKKKIIEPIDLEKNEQKEAERRKMESLATRSRRVRDDVQRKVEGAERSILSQASMMKKHMETNILPVPATKDSAGKVAVEMRRQDLAQLFKKSFALSFDQMQRNRLVRDFSAKMDRIRKELVSAFERKLDDLCRRRPKQPTRGQNDAKTADNSTLSDCNPDKEETKKKTSPPKSLKGGRLVPWKAFYRLKYQSKMAKPARNSRLRSSILRRLQSLASGRALSPFVGHLPSFWSLIRSRRRAKLHLVPQLRRLAEAATVSEDDMLRGFSLIHLESVAMAVKKTTVCWLPLPPLCSGTSGQVSKAAWDNSDENYDTVAQRRRSSQLVGRPSATLRLLKRLTAVDDGPCSLLVRCGRRPTEAKLVTDWADKQRQIDISCAILPGKFLPPRSQNPDPDVPDETEWPDVVAKISVDTRHCLWDVGELTALAKELIINCKESERQMHRACLERTLMWRRTYQQLQSTPRSPPRELDSLVALHASLSTKLTAAVLLPGVMKAYPAAFSFHADDVLFARQPDQKELKMLQSLLGGGRVKLADVYRKKV